MQNGATVFFYSFVVLVTWCIFFVGMPTPTNARALQKRNKEMFEVNAARYSSEFCVSTYYTRKRETKKTAVTRNCGAVVDSLVSSIVLAWLVLQLPTSLPYQYPLVFCYSVWKFCKLRMWRHFSGELDLSPWSHLLFPPWVSVHKNEGSRCFWCTEIVGCWIPQVSNA